MSTPTQEHPDRADEPHTPSWLTALGALLFLAAGIWWAVTPGAKSVEDNSTHDVDAGAAPAVKPQ